MNKLLVSISSLLVSTAAFSADLPRKSVAVVMAPAPISSWTGAYVGGHIGGAGARTQDKSNTNLLGINGLYFGAQAGYDQQFNGNFVAGVAADFSFGNIRGSDAISTIVQPYSGSLRGRLGVALAPHLLVYGTAGLAFSNLKYVAATTQAVNHLGWTVGFGGEAKIDRNWSLFSEFRYSKYNAASYGSIVGVPNVNSEQFLDARAGVNYRF